jgi:uncharacterized protein YfaS (alpha-2-macroglobulin family)
MEFRDMQAVHDVDPKLIERTRRWLLSQRQADGTWLSIDRHGRNQIEVDRLRTTSYVAWAVYDRQPNEAEQTRQFMLKHAPDSISDPYVLALVCNALLAIDPKDEAVRPYLERLESLRRTLPDGQQSWWDIAGERETVFYGTGSFASVEATALAALAYMKADVQPAAVHAALAWLVQRRGVGNWGTTQATILALKALLAGTGKSSGDGRREIEIALDGKVVKSLEIAAEEAEVMKQVDLSPLLKPGKQTLTLRDKNNSGAGFQVAFRYHRPGSPPVAEEPLSIELTYDRQKVAVNQYLTVSATIKNNMQQPAPMVMLDLPVPAGFAVETADFEALVAEKKIGRFQVTPRQVLVYLRELSATPLQFRYRLKATAPASISVPPGRVYEYYDPAKQGRSSGAKITVSTSTD